MMQWHADLFWLLSLILGWKARQLTRSGQAIEFLMCAQRCVSVGRLPWSNGVFSGAGAGGRQRRQEGGERAQGGQRAHQRTNV